MEHFEKLNDALNRIKEKSLTLNKYEELFLMWDKHNDEYWLSSNSRELNERMNDSYEDSGYELSPDEESALYAIWRYITTDYYRENVDKLKLTLSGYKEAQFDGLMVKELYVEGFTKVSLGFSY